MGRLGNRKGASRMPKESRPAMPKLSGATGLAVRHVFPGDRGPSALDQLEQLLADALYAAFVEWERRTLDAPVSQQSKG
jgi:hypothetical protein